jgi:ferredoxin-NADP reductase
MGWLLATAMNLPAQVSPSEHAKHHPGQSGSAVPGAMGANPPASPGGMGGMMDMMGEMMKGMGPQQKEAYPALMSLPELPLEKRQEIELQAEARMSAASQRMTKASDALASAAERSDFAGMQTALSQMQDGLAEFQSSLAARRALAEGQAPREVALAWFKQQMNLGAAPPTEERHTLFGMSRFHFAVMALLIAFAMAMLAMYFFKMRRAAALLTRLAGETSPAIAKPAPPISPPKAAEKWAGPLRVARIFDETHEVKTLRLVSPNGGPLPFTFKPGQFLTIKVELPGQRVLRSYTIASSPTQQHYCEITVKREDRHSVSAYLHESVKEGAVLSVEGPFGKFTFTGGEADGIVLIAGGVGITPMMSVVRYLTDIAWPKDIHLLLCIRLPEDFIFREELEQLARRNPNLHVTASITRGGSATAWKGRTGRFDAAALRTVVPDIVNRRIHICGPISMMDAVKKALLEIGVPPSSIFTESFGAEQKQAAPSPTANGTTGTTITFQASQRSVPLPDGQTILDAAEAASVNIENSCRVGTCGTCKVKLLSGKVTMECQDGLSADDRNSGFVLACQAKATVPITVDA